MDVFNARAKGRDGTCGWPHDFECWTDGIAQTFYPPLISHQYKEVWILTVEAACLLFWGISVLSVGPMIMTYMGRALISFEPALP